MTEKGRRQAGGPAVKNCSQNLCKSMDCDDDCESYCANPTYKWKKGRKNKNNQKEEQKILYNIVQVETLPPM